MSHSSDIKAKSLTGTDDLDVGRARIRGVHVLAAATGNPQLVIRDGGSGGATILDVKFSTNDTEDDATHSHTLFIPADGILSVNDPHLTLTNLAQVTVFYA